MTYNANAARLNAVIEFLVEAGECSRFQVVKIDSVIARGRIVSLANQVGLRVFESACQSMSLRMRRNKGRA